MKFAFVAFDNSGKRHEDIVDAATEIAARDTLSDRGLFVTEIRAGGGAPRQKKGNTGRRQPKWRCLAEFTRQMAILVSTGTPLVQALGAVERQVTDARFSGVVGEIRARVEEGSSLADAVGRHPAYFDAVARSLIAAGEASGNLDKMLTRLASVNRQQEVVRRSVVAALSYPSMLFCIAVVVLIGMMMFVVPRFSVLFESLDTPLPPTTAVLMDISNFLRASWWWCFPSVLFGLGAGVAWLYSKPGRRAIDNCCIRLPGISKLFIALAMARIARVLGVLVESRVPLLDALALTKAAMTNCHYRDLLSRAEHAVTRGGSMSSVVNGSSLVSPAFAEAIKSGEESGKVGQVLTSLADYLDEDNALLVKSITQLLEPIVLVILGLVVGTVAVSMFLPLFDATAATGRPGGVH